MAVDATRILILGGPHDGEILPSGGLHRLPRIRLPILTSIPPRFEPYAAALPPSPRTACYDFDSVREPGKGPAVFVYRHSAID